MRGVPLNKQSAIHIPGCGDLKIKDISFLPDPCPLPEQLKKRALVERERLIYAPFSGVGGIVYDKDAVYVELGGSHSHTKDDTGLVSQLLQTQETLDHKLEQSELQFFTDSAPIKSQDVKQIFKEEKVVDQGRIRRKVIFNDSENPKATIEDDEDDEDNNDEETDDEMDVEDELNDLNDENEKNNDSEDEVEDDSDDDNDDKELEAESNITGSPKKRKKNEKPSKKKIKLDPSASITNSENSQVYRELSKNQDKHVKNKISEALSLIGDKSQKKSDAGKKEDDDESFDELSDDEEMNFKLDFDQAGENAEVVEDEDDVDEENEDEDEDDNMKWKTNIAQRAREAFLTRQQSNVNVMRLVYGVFDNKGMQEEENEPEDDADEVGGIFRVVQAKQKQKVQERELKNKEESVFFSKEPPRDWLGEDNKVMLVNRFVTGKWKESEDAEELLKLGNIIIPLHVI